MGSDARATLFYGFEFYDSENYDLDEETSDHLEKLVSEGLDECYAAKLGWVDDSGFFTKEGNYAFKQGTPKFTEAEKRWDKRRDEKRDLLKLNDLGVKNDCYGSGYHTSNYYLHLAEFSTDWESLQEVPALPEITPEQIANLKKYCEIMEIPYKEPKWFLAAYYG